jgi:hypothetical protein
MNSISPQALAYDAEIADLTQQLEKARERVKTLEGELDWWERGRDMFGHSASNGSAPSEPKPTLAQAIVRLMIEGDRTEWPTSAIMEALESRGWMPNGATAEHAVRSKLAKLARGENAALERVHHGTYALREANPEEP